MTQKWQPRLGNHSSQASGGKGRRQGAVGGVLSPARCQALARQFLSEVQGVVATSEIYGEAHDALFNGYFPNLMPFRKPGDFGLDSHMRQLPRPRPMHLMVDP